MCMEIMEEDLADDEIAFLTRYKDIDTLSELWQLMDLEWEKCHADYGLGSDESLTAYYQSPVWLLNGIFSDCDPESHGHREAIADWIKAIRPRLVVDYGGGFGCLARKIASRCPDADIVIVEPHPCKVALRLAKQYKNINYSDTLPLNADVVIAQDVLEHIPDPLSVCRDLTRSIRAYGHLITANCFQPVIKCHLPNTFHLKYTFRFIIPFLGYEYNRVVSGADHAQIYKKTGANPDFVTVRRLELLSRIAYPVLDTAVTVAKPAWRFARKHLFG